jgi:hypothetical protein
MISTNLLYNASFFVKTYTDLSFIKSNVLQWINMKQISICLAKLNVNINAQFIKILQYYLPNVFMHAEKYELLVSHFQSLQILSKSIPLQLNTSHTAPSCYPSPSLQSRHNQLGCEIVSEMKYTHGQDLSHMFSLHQKITKKNAQGKLHTCCNVRR